MLIAGFSTKTEGPIGDVDVFTINYLGSALLKKMRGDLVNAELSDAQKKRGLVAIDKTLRRIRLIEVNPRLDWGNLEVPPDIGPSPDDWGGGQIRPPDLDDDGWLTDLLGAALSGKTSLFGLAKWFVGWAIGQGFGSAFGSLWSWGFGIIWSILWFLIEGGDEDDGGDSEEGERPKPSIGFFELTAALSFRLSRIGNRSGPFVPGAVFEDIKNSGLFIEEFDEHDAIHA